MVEKTKKTENKKLKTEKMKIGGNKKYFLIGIILFILLFLLFYFNNNLIYLNNKINQIKYCNLNKQLYPNPIC